MKQPILVGILSVFISLVLLLSPMFPLFTPTTSVHAQTADRLAATLAFHDSQGNIWIIDEDGANVRQITNKGRDCCAAWSPDGNRLYFLRFPSSGLDGRQAGGVVMAYDFATASEQQVGPNDLKAEASGIAIAPDGAHLAFTHNFKLSNPQDLRSSYNCLAQLSVITGEYEDLQCGGPWASPSYSPDGSEIVATNGILESVAITIYSLTNRTLRDIGCCVASGYFPDGKAVLIRGYYGFLDPALFSQSNSLGAPGQTGLFSQDLATAKLHPLLISSDTVSGAAISPDGMRLVYTHGSEQEKNGQIEILDLATGDTRQVRSGYSPTWQPSAQTLNSTDGLIGYIDANGNLWLTQPDGLGRAQITFDGELIYVKNGLIQSDPRVVMYTNPKWSPDGKLLGVVRYEAQQGSTLLILDPAEPRNLVSIAPINYDFLTDGFDWSPDSQKLIYADTGSLASLWTYEIKSRKAEQVIKPQNDRSLFGPYWSPDSSHILLGEWSPFFDVIAGTAQYGMADLRTGPTYTLLEKPQLALGYLTCDWAHNSQRIACVNVTDLVLLSAGPCPVLIFDTALAVLAQLPTENDSCDSQPAWSPDDRRLAVGALVGDPYKSPQQPYIDLLDANGAKRTRLADGIPLDWSPDGHYLVALDRKSRLSNGLRPEQDANIIVIDATTGATTARLALGHDAAWQPTAPFTLNPTRIDEKQALIQRLSNLTVDSLGLDLSGLEIPVLKSYDEGGAQALLDEVAASLDNGDLTPQAAAGFDRLVILEGAVRDLSRVSARAVHDTTRSIIGIVGVTTQLLQTVQHFRNIIKGVPLVGNVIEQLLRKIEEKAMDILSGFLDLIANTIPDPIIRDGAQRAADLIDQAIRLRVDQGQSLVEALLEGVGVAVGDQALIASFVISTQPALDVAVDTAAASLEPAGTSTEAQQRTQAVVETQQTQGEAAHQTYEDMTATADIAKLIGSIADLTSAVVSPSGVGTVIAQIFSSVAKAVTIGTYGHATVTNFDVMVDTGQAVYSAEQLAFDPGSAALTPSPSSATELMPIANRSVNQNFVAAQRAQIDQSADEYRAVLNQIVQAVDANQSTTVSSLIPLLLAADRAFTTQAKVSIAATGSEQPATAQAQTALYAARVQFDADSAGLYGLLISYLIEPDNLTNRTQLIEQSQATSKTIETYASALPVPTPPNAGQIPAPTVVVAAVTWPERVIAGQPFDLSIELVNAGPTPAIDAYARVRSSGIVTTDQVLMFDSLSGTGSVTRTLTLRAGETGQAVLGIDALTIAGQTDTSRLVINVEPADSGLPTGLPISPIGLGVALGVIIVIGLTAIFIVRRRSKAKN